MRTLIAMLVIGSVTSLTGCASSLSLYERMNQSAQPTDPALLQTQLAHIGHVETCEGRFEICFQRLVITGMPSPRGQSKLLIFTRDGQLARPFSYPNFENIPLWCESGRLYLFGFASVPEIPCDPAIADAFSLDETPTGNVIDFSQGLGRAVLTREQKYGSSGGIEDEWRRN